MRETFSVGLLSHSDDQDSGYCLTLESGNTEALERLRIGGFSFVRDTRTTMSNEQGFVRNERKSKDGSGRAATK